MYWTNIPGIEQPEDLGIVLRDVLETCSTKSKLTYNTPKQFVSEEAIEKYVQDKNAEVNDTYNKRTVKGDKSTTIRPNNNTANVWVNEKAIRENKPTYNTPKQVGVAADLKGYDIIKRVYSENGKSPTLTTMGGGHREPKVAVKGGAIRARSKDSKGKHVGWKETKPKQVLEIRKDDKSNSLTSATKDSVAVKEEELTWRKLTPLECERLQTFPDNYSEGVSNTQRYKMLGNGFTVRVIEHILKNMEI